MERTDTEIRILPDHIANQIAAGEVVQRPESLVKEVVENALDAGATTIAVVVRGAGKQLVHIIDNGKGMSREDLLLSIKRHATSKIKTSEDLERIMTLGFRGEALASIASVAHLEIRSRRPHDDIGWKLLSEPLREPTIEPCAMDVGTQVFVRNVFYNVPARRKFLRSDLTEFRHIADTMTKFALGYPHVRFVLYDDDALIYDLQPAELRTRVAEVLGKPFADALLPVHSTEVRNGSTIEISGFIGQPTFAKKSKSEQFLYLNRRAISSRQLSHAVMSGYEHLIDQASYPPFLLFLTVDVERVDVNVHPQKHEVKFDDERTIYSAVRRAVVETLARNNLTPQATLLPAAADANAPFETFRLQPNTTNASNTAPRFEEALLINRLTGEILSPSVSPDMPNVSGNTTPYTRATSTTNTERPPHYERANERRLREQEFAGFEALFGERASPFLHLQHIEPAAETHPTAETQQNALNADAQVGTQVDAQESQNPYNAAPMRLYWQLHRKYILMPTPKGLAVIDQHAAHERILYERALKAMNEGFAYAQELLFPVITQLTPSEAALVKEVEEELMAMGFQVKFTNALTLEIHAVPADVRSGREKETLKDLLEQYREYQHIRHTSTRDNLAASFGCRSAIRAGDVLTMPEMRQLVEDLYATSMPFACPHGRPIIIEFPLEEFDRRFGRSS